MGVPTDRSESSRVFSFSRKLHRRGVVFAATASLVAVGAGFAASASAKNPVTADDSRATVVQDNVNSCPSGEPLLVTGDTSSATLNGITVTVDHLTAAAPNPYPAGGWTTLPDKTAILTVTLPAGKVLTGDIYVKGGDGYNKYPGSDTDHLIPPANGGGQIAGLSHFLVCGTLENITGSISVHKVVSGSGTGSAGPFTVDVDCGSDGDFPLTLSAGDTKTVDNLPDGASCKVSETASSNATTISYTANATTSPDAPTVTVVGGDTEAVTVTNTYALGHVDVKKVVSGTDPNGAETYPITVDCAGTVTHLTLGGGDDQVVDAPGGTTCTVTETNSHGATVTYTVNAMTGGSPASVQVANNQTTDVTVTNTFTSSTPPPSVGSVKVAKSTSGAVPANLGTFEFALNCGGVVTQVTVNSGDSQTVNNIPTGTSCTLTETDAKNASSTTFSIGGQAVSPATFTVGNNTTTEVDVDNHYAGAVLTVTKAVTGDAPANASYAFNADCGAAGVFPFSIAANGSHPISNLPGGTVCTVTETDSQNASSTTFTVNGNPANSPVQVTMAIGGATTVAATNNYPTPPGDGTLIIKKIVHGSGSGSAGPFTVSADCGQAGTFDFTGLVNGSIQSHSVAAGASCAVTETDANGAVTETYTINTGTPTATPPSVNIPSGGSTTVTVTNTFITPTGALSIHKAVDKTSANYGDNLTYTLTVAATGQVAQQNVTVKDKVPAKTAFVSAHCAAPCTVSGPTGKTVTWHLGTMAAGSSATLTMVVNVTFPTVGPNGLPVEVISNHAVAASSTHRVPSNTVHTNIGAVLGEKVIRKHHHKKTPSSELPFTGFNAATAATVGLLMLLIGMVLAMTRREVAVQRLPRTAIDRLRNRGGGRGKHRA